MKRTRFTEEQIVGILKGEAGLKTTEVCRQDGISEATFYNWKAKYGGMAVSDVQKAEASGRGKQQAEARGGRSDTG